MGCDAVPLAAVADLFDQLNKALACLLNVAVKSKAKHLGVYFALGGRTRELTSGHSRWAATATRRHRVVRLGRKLGGHVFRTGLQPAALYGASVALPRLSTIRDMRRAAARTMGPLSGRSVIARLAVSKCDPSKQSREPSWPG